MIPYNFGLDSSNLPLVYYLIAFHNEEQFIIECLSFIISQDHPRIELVPVDDGSADVTYEPALKLKSNAVSIYFSICRIIHIFYSLLSPNYKRRILPINQFLMSCVQ